MKKGVQIAIGAGAVALILGGYAATNLDEIGTFQYFQTLDEFVAAGETGKPVRVHGYVATGSIVRDVGALEVRFEVVAEPPHKGDTGPLRLPVVYASLETPDMFKDGAEVVVEGQLTAQGGLFHADNVMAKCPSKFEAMSEAETATL